MNLVGKIFTVVVFLMTIMFATFAVAVYATHKNWRDVVLNPTTGLTVQLENARSENKVLNEKKKTLEDERQVEKAQHLKVVTELENAADLLRKERADFEKKNAELQAQVRDSIAAVKATHEQLANLRKENETLRDDIKVAQADRDAKQKEVVRLTDEAHNAQNERARLERSTHDLTDQLAKAYECLRYNNLNPTSNYKDKDPPAGLQGQVTAAPRPDAIEISIGSDDGLRKGHKLEVVRMDATGVNYVGRIEVLTTFYDRAVCRPVAAMLKSPIQKGDRVYAKLSEVQ